MVEIIESISEHRGRRGERVGERGRVDRKQHQLRAVHKNDQDLS